MAKKDFFVIKPIAPLDIDSEQGGVDIEQAKWLLARSNLTTRFRDKGLFVDENGNRCRVIKICGIGAKKLSKKFAKEFNWGDSDGALELMVEKKTAKIDKIKK